MPMSEAREIDRTGKFAYLRGGSIGSAHRLDRALKPTIHLHVTGWSGTEATNGTEVPKRADCPRAL
ncbi:hypothetical protein EMEDMD4_170031 [Sinorhizobium medicae]|uniref:Uncharacterized protein n=1 Tax=Sinorhizobium medicae TaxID=110321 RepID=A0A508WWY1_9HYPH|nr:hypothetical protein EMEDMD4_170031 [Sinorhizobium medicae]